MARVPVIASPCPLRFRNTPQPGLDFCGHCQRRVHNLDAMSEAERVAFLTGCEDKVCVSYTVRRRPLVTVGAMLAGALASGAVAADGPEDSTLEWVRSVQPAENQAADCDELIIVGGTSHAVQWVDESEVSAPDLPTIGEADWLPSDAAKDTGG